jgi:hypothetical protein
MSERNDDQGQIQSWTSGSGSLVQEGICVMAGGQRIGPMIQSEWRSILIGIWSRIMEMNADVRWECIRAGFMVFYSAVTV